MPFQNLTIEEWRRYTDAEKSRLAERLAGNLPQPVRATAVRTFRAADPQDTLAVFDFQGAAFVLIPGSTATVGFDARRFHPTAVARVQGLPARRLDR